MGRRDPGRQAGRDFAKTLGPDLDVKFYRFDSKLTEPKAGRSWKIPNQRPRDVARLGDAMKRRKRQEGTLVAWPGL